MADGKQYDACMGIMVRISLDQLTDLRDEFQAKNMGLNQKEFVEVMLKYLAHDPNNVVPVVGDLIELFAQVDVNGDGTMEWEEFTNFIIDAGMDVEQRRTPWRDLQYEVSRRYNDTYLRFVSDMKYLPQIKRLLVLDADRPVVRIYDPSTLFLDDPYVTPDLKLVHEFHPLWNTAGKITRPANMATRQAASSAAGWRSHRPTHHAAPSKSVECTQ